MKLPHVISLKLIGHLLSVVALWLSCSHLKKGDPTTVSGNYNIDPDGEGGLEPFSVYCDMTNKNGVGVTVISHDSESRTIVDGYEDKGSYSRDINYTGASLSQLAGLTSVSLHCEQFFSSTSVTTQFLGITPIHTDGGCHVILLR